MMYIAVSRMPEEQAFDNMSIDLMFGLPNQTLDMLTESVDKALELDSRIIQSTA